MTRSTVTTEAIAGVADLKAGYTLGHADVAILKALSAELLAVREAQGVPIGCIKTICGNKTLKWWRDAPEGVEVFTAPPAPAVPDDVIGTLKLALDAMEFMGDALNELDAATPDGIVRVTPAFSAVRSMIAAAPTPTKAVRDE